MFINQTEAYLAAHAACDAAEALDAAIDCTCGRDDTTCAGCDARTAWLAAARACDAARAAWLASDEEREYHIRDSNGTWTITSSPDEIESDAEESLREGDWDTSDGSLHLSATVYTLDCVTGDRIDDQMSVSVSIEPEEPDCVEGEAHDWCAPHSGVWAKGGGVIIREVCAHCAVRRVTDTWAQDRLTGKQGLTEVSYRRG